MINKSLGILELKGFAGYTTCISELGKLSALKIVKNEEIGIDKFALIITGHLGALRNFKEEGASLISEHILSFHIIAQPHSSLFNLFEIKD